ncbi:TolC family outer membrane protein [Variovorax sp. KK3]|uniref:TolC family outer membrane protein n=1 Tax=Variovorax sp. KK3 TaxID=1855728 RepID=UPI00097CBAE6|nr:TolC family outer membrane protein [Variovorax sp. KK3]
MNTIRMKQAAAAVLITAASGAAFALDLMASYEGALRADPTMRAAEQALLAGREKAVQGDALLKPQVSLQASLSRVSEKSTVNTAVGSSQSDSRGNVHQVGVQLVQPLYDPKAGADRKQLHQQSALAEVSHRDAQQDLLRRVAEAYFNVLLARETVRVAQAEQAAVLMQRDRAQARFDVGRGRITDLQEAQARYDSVGAREVSAQSNLALRQAQYRELTGLPAEGLAALRAGFAPAAPQPDSLESWQMKGSDGNTRVLVKRSEVLIATAEIDKYKLSGRPTVDLVASFTRQGQNGSLPAAVSPDSGRGASVGVQLTVPLYTGGALNSRHRESIARRDQAEQELGAAQRDARLQVQDAFLAVKTGVARIGALEQSVVSARTALEATTLGRDLGSRTELDVLDAQQRLYTAELDLAQAKNDYLLGRIRLASAAGELREDDLRALDGYLVR